MIDCNEWNTYMDWSDCCGWDTLAYTSTLTHPTLLSLSLSCHWHQWNSISNNPLAVVFELFHCWHSLTALIITQYDDVVVNMLICLLLWTPAAHASQRFSGSKQINQIQNSGIISLLSTSKGLEMDEVSFVTCQFRWIGFSLNEFMERKQAGISSRFFLQKYYEKFVPWIIYRKPT